MKKLLLGLFLIPTVQALSLLELAKLAASYDYHRHAVQVGLYNLLWQEQNARYTKVCNSYGITPDQADKKVIVGTEKDALDIIDKCTYQEIEKLFEKVYKGEQVILAVQIAIHAKDCTFTAATRFDKTNFPRSFEFFEEKIAQQEHNKCLFEAICQKLFTSDMNPFTE